MLTKVFSICDAYESGYGHGIKQDNLHSPYEHDTEETEAYGVGYRTGEVKALKAKQDNIFYYFISYRVIKASGSILYHYAITDEKPADWVINKLAFSEFKDHYSVTHVEKVDRVFYDTYRNFFTKEDNIDENQE